MRGVLETGEIDGPVAAGLSRILKRDQEEHPECSYSQSKSSTCRLVNGDRSCETLRKVLRVCPGQTPVEIYSASEQNSGESEAIGGRPLDEGAPGDPFGNGLFGGGGGFGGGLFGHFGGDIFSELLRPWKSFGLPDGGREMPFPDFVPPPTARDGGIPAEENGGDKKWWSRLFNSAEPPHRYVRFVFYGLVS